MDISHTSNSHGVKVWSVYWKALYIMWQRIRWITLMQGESNTVGSNDRICHRLVTIDCLITAPTPVLAVSLKFGTRRRIFRWKGYLIRSPYTVTLSSVSLWVLLHSFGDRILGFEENAAQIPRWPTWPASLQHLQALHPRASVWENNSIYLFSLLFRDIPTPGTITWSMNLTWEIWFSSV